MGRVVVVNHMTLDGVMQAPGRPDEDRRDGFAHGGWAQPGSDAVMAETMAKGVVAGGPLLLGRRTYEDFAHFWPGQPDNPFSSALENMQKYVVSRTLEEPLPWINSTLLSGEAAETVAGLKGQTDSRLTILGSGELVRSLMPDGLIDEWMLLIHPLVLGSGRRLFPADAYARLHLTDSVTTTTGVMICAYRPTQSGGESDA